MRKEGGKKKGRKDIPTAPPLHHTFTYRHTRVGRPQVNANARALDLPVLALLVAGPASDAGQQSVSGARVERGEDEDAHPSKASHQQ
jgi:hypothetical protein